MRRRWWFAEMLIGAYLTIAIFAVGYGVASQFSSTSPTPARSDAVDIAPPVAVPVAPDGFSVFGFEGYLGALALLMIVLTLSDYKYRFRLSVGAFDLRPVAFIISAFIGFALLAVELSAASEWPANWSSFRPLIQTLLGASFLILVVWLTVVAFFAPPKFGRWNSHRYFRVVYRLILEGDKTECPVAARELLRSIEAITRSAISSPQSEQRNTARLMFALIADKRFCRTIVEHAPRTAAEIFRWLGRLSVSPPLVAQLCRNLGTELVLNTASPLRAETEGYHVGLVGYWKPLSNEIYGNYELISGLADQHASPLDLNWPDRMDLAAEQYEAFLRAANIFASAFLQKDRDLSHSRAFLQVLDLVEENCNDLWKLDGQVSVEWTSDIYQKARMSIGFIKSVLRLMEERQLPYEGKLRAPDANQTGLHDSLARVIVEIVKRAASVKEPADTAWTIQHNTVWGDLFSFDDGVHWRAVRFKVRRLIYDEIRKMERFPNFQGARILGFCLNVLGLHPTRSQGYGREFAALKLACQAFAVRHYSTFRRDYPDVAEAVLVGGLTFDPGTSEIVKTYAKFIEKEPRRARLKVKPEQRKRSTRTQPRTRSRKQSSDL